MPMPTPTASIPTAPLPTPADRVRAFADTLRAVHRPLVPAQAAAVAAHLDRLAKAAAAHPPFAAAFAEAAALVRQNHAAGQRPGGLTVEQAAELGGWLARCAAHMDTAPAAHSGPVASGGDAA
ncbi:hypothetical protein HL658_09860 [Azospirillum sp. RWY-5-1]|uniref:Uncharacterized protein n=1 Tax=Azospirillum oleiclasticum TaxID=2735135 RepID=A0ABX2T9S3_9PROT|nr:hypothetical protein [Azospirillum oleiclasticum]NYZ12857.1 hypothetical protein [Azospirillum oleiclasticum]NYZ20017.1 hypothetical protein [Azospirillum oleiclasticum]